MKHVRCIILVVVSMCVLLAMPSVNAQEDSTGVTATTQSNLNMRAEPTTSSDIVDGLETGVTLDVSMWYVNEADELWLMVTYEGTRGWIAGWLVTIEGDVETLPRYGEMSDELRQRFETENPAIPDDVANLLDYLDEGRVILALEHDHLRVYETEGFYQRFPLGAPNPLLEDPEVWYRVKIVVVTEVARKYAVEDLSAVTYEDVASDPDYYLGLESNTGGTIAEQRLRLNGSVMRVRSSGASGMSVSVDEFFHQPILWFRLGNVDDNFTNALPREYTSRSNGLGMFLAGSESGDIVRFYYRVELADNNYHARLVDGVTVSFYFELTDFIRDLQDVVGYERPEFEDEVFVLGDYLLPE